MENNNFEWTTFYNEFAQALLKYKDDRKELLSFIYNDLNSSYTTYLHESDGKQLEDICPFTIFGIFNRGIRTETRTIIAERFKSFFNLKSKSPESFSGIPVLNNQKSHFFGYKQDRKPDDIKNLWVLFEQALSDPYSIEQIFNKVISQYCINVNITMGLYWILPEYFIALDKQNRAYLAYYDIKTKNKVPQFTEYKSLIDTIKEEMINNKVEEKTFPQFSFNAWMRESNNQDNNELEDSDDHLPDFIIHINRLLNLKKNLILQGAPGTGKTRAAKDIAEMMIYGTYTHDKKEQAYLLEKSNRYKLVQFHPSYTYEDFVRGIKIDVEDGHPRYRTVDKVLGIFAKEAYKNWIDSQKEIEEVVEELTYEQALDNLKKEIEEKKSIGKDYNIPNTSAVIVGVEEDSFRYSFPNRPNILYTLLYSDLLKVCTHKDAITKSTDIENLGLIMKGKHPYYYHIFNELERFKNAINSPITTEKIELQNYVLVIDEINRANLSVVLGELIYALEYRGEAVGSTYDSDKEALILPPNLYIIGTMNTADRSVGQIDYAIRRRFAFFDLLPTQLDDESFDVELFAKVSELFVSNYEQYLNGEVDLLQRSEYLSTEFRPKDVWLGHSYFIMKTDNESCIDNQYRQMRLDYEIKPILDEYVRDGILNPTAEGFINNLE